MIVVRANSEGPWSGTTMSAKEEAGGLGGGRVVFVRVLGNLLLVLAWCTTFTVCYYSKDWWRGTSFQLETTLLVAEVIGGLGGGQWHPLPAALCKAVLRSCTSFACNVVLNVIDFRHRGTTPPVTEIGDVGNGWW